MTYHNVRRHPNERSSGKGCDLPKCLPTLTGFGSDPDACERTLKKICHALQVCISVDFALDLRSGEHLHQVLTLCSRGIPGNPSYVGVPLTELTDRIQSHTTFRTTQ